MPDEERSIDFEQQKPKGMFPWLTWKNVGLAVACLLFLFFLIVNNRDAKPKASSEPQKNAAAQKEPVKVLPADAGVGTQQTQKTTATTTASQAGVGTSSNTANTQAGQTIDWKKEIEAQRKRKEIESAFADNVVKFETVSETHSSEPQKNSSQSSPVPSQPTQPATQQRDLLAFDPNQPLCTLPETTVIDAVLDSKLAGEMTGPVDAHISNDVYCPNTRTVVLPQGTRLSGESAKVSTQNQKRLGIVFHSMLVQPPLGSGKQVYTIPLDEQEPALNQEGAMGVDGKVNNHFWSLLGTASVVGLIQGASIGIYSGGNGGYSPTYGVMTGLSQSTANTTSQILNRKLNVLPEIEVPQGKPLVVRLLKHKQVPFPVNQWNLN